MTVIAFDGNTLAADRRASHSGGSIASITKIRKVRGHLLGVSGSASGIPVLMKWFEDGCDVTKWPDIQKDKDRWCDFIVITPDKKILHYEQDPLPFHIEEKRFAFGSGGKYALVAMEMGMNASDAVLIASKFDSGCGNGVDVISLEVAENLPPTEHSHRDFY